MSEIRFYHLTRKKLEDTLPVLLEKTLARGWKAVVMTSSAERAESLASLLWTYNRDGFLPHGTAKDGHAEDQPIWITPEDENPASANTLFLTDSATSSKIDGYELVCELFDGHDEAALNAARSRWMSYKAQGHALTYWKQTETGWVKEK